MKKLVIMFILIAFPAAFAFSADEKADAKKTEKTSKEYIADLTSSNEDTVVAAEDWIGQKKESSATDQLLNLLKGDKREKVRMNAAVALGLIGDKKTAEPISEALLNELSADVRYAEVLSITRIGIDTKKTAENLMAAKDKESDPFIKDYVSKMEEKFKNK